MLSFAAIISNKVLLSVVQDLNVHLRGDCNRTGSKNMVCYLHM